MWVLGLAGVVITLGSCSVTMHKTELLETFPLAQHRPWHLLSALATAYSTLGKLTSLSFLCLRSDFSCMQYLVLTQFFLPLSQRDSVGYAMSQTTVPEHLHWVFSVGYTLYRAGRDLPLVPLSCFLSRNVILNTFCHWSGQFLRRDHFPAPM